MPSTSKIGIIGNGNVGSALQRGLSKAGYEVRSTGNEPTKVGEVGKWADLVILAVPYNARQDAVQELGAGVQGKPLVDVTNALGKDMQFAGNLQRSGAEELQALVPKARVVKAFNTVFAQNMEDGQVGGEALTLFAAADDEAAKRQVLEIGQAMGYDAVDAGPLEHARWLEPLGYFNIALSSKAKHGPNTGFRYVHAREGAARGARPAPNAPRHEKGEKVAARSDRAASATYSPE